MGIKSFHFLYIESITHIQRRSVERKKIFRQTDEQIILWDFGFENKVLYMGQLYAILLYLVAVIFIWNNNWHQFFHSSLSYKMCFKQHFDFDRLHIHIVKWYIICKLMDLHYAKQKLEILLV